MPPNSTTCRGGGSRGGPSCPPLSNLLLALVALLVVAGLCRQRLVSRSAPFAPPRVDRAASRGRVSVPASTSVLVLVLSSLSEVEVERRWTARSTWIPALVSAWTAAGVDTRVRFVVGRGERRQERFVLEASQEEDMLCVPCGDTYEHLPVKVRLGLAAAAEERQRETGMQTESRELARDFFPFDYVVKVDSE